jgi:hypothetical protein
VEHVNFQEFARRYCERHVNSPTRLAETLREKNAAFKPTGWLLLECQDFASSRFGHYAILPYGGNATLQEIPDRPISPRGCASDISVVVAVIKAEEVPS